MYLYIMIQILLHLLGDYFLQNDWMAVNKGKYSVLGYLTCTIHCLLYSIPFGMYYHSWDIFLLVFGSHFLIDKFGLAIYWTMLVNWNWSRENFGMNVERPAFLTLWLHIIRDNSLHIAGNYFILQSLL